MPTDPIRTSIVVCLTDDGPATERTLAAAERAMTCGGTELVVAGITEPGLAERIRSRFPDAVTILSVAPIPAAEARKRGAAAARGKRLLVVEGNRVVPSAWIEGPGDRTPATAGHGGIASWLARIGRGFRRSTSPVARSAEPSPDPVQEARRLLERGDDEGAILQFRQALPGSTTQRPWMLLGLASVLFRQERIHEAEELYRECADGLPTMNHGPAGIARVLQARQEWQAAHEAWREVADRFPGLPEGSLGMASVLAKLGRFDEADVVLGAAVSRWPKDVSVRMAQARLASDLGDHRQACDRWREAVGLAPTSFLARAGWVRSLLDVVEIDTARRVFEDTGEVRPPAWYGMILADIHAATFDWPAALDVFGAISGAAPDDLTLRLREALFLVRVAGYTCQPHHLDRAVALCESLSGRFPHSVRARVALAETYVVAARDGDAIRVIDRLPNDLVTQAEVAKLKAWRQAKAGDVAGAKATWHAIERDHFFPAIHAPPGELEPVGGRAIAPGPAEILLFTVIRDEAWRLPWFLDAYRRLGVDRFLVVDNGSTDGGTDYLLAQPDVHLFPTFASYAAAMSGMRWINALVDRFGAGHWCLYVDVDELLVFPGVEDHGLRPLLDYMDRRGHEALRAFMLDMHASVPHHRPEARPGDDPLRLLPYFDATYHEFGAVECPYRRMGGGIRRLAGTTFDMTKTPIIRGGRSIRFLSSSHQTTPCAVTDVTGALLHFKLAGAPARWTVETIGDRRPGCVRRHLAESRPARAGGGDHGRTGPSAVRYESSRQLLDLGLIECPDAFAAGRSPAEDSRDD